MNWIEVHSRVDEGVTVGSTVCFLQIIWRSLQHFLNKVFNMHLIGFLLRATMREWKLALYRPGHYVSPETQGRVRCKKAAVQCNR